MAVDTYEGLAGDDIGRIVRDVALGVPIEDSRVDYGPVERRFRADIESWAADNPDAVLDTGYEAADADLEIPELEELRASTTGATLAAERFYEGTGAMIALMLPDAVSTRLACPGGVPSGDMHVTLAYLSPDAAGEQPATRDNWRLALHEFVNGNAARALRGRISGSGRFNPEASDGEAVVYASLDVPGLAALRTALVQTLEAYGVPLPSGHDFTPHVTLAYGDAELPELPTLDVAFDRITLCIGDERTDFHLPQDRALAAAEFVPEPVQLGDLPPSREDRLAEALATLASREQPVPQVTIAEGAIQVQVHPPQLFQEGAVQIENKPETIHEQDPSLGEAVRQLGEQLVDIRGQLKKVPEPPPPVKLVATDAEYDAEGRISVRIQRYSDGSVVRQKVHRNKAGRIERVE